MLENPHWHTSVAYLFYIGINTDLQKMLSHDKRSTLRLHWKYTLGEIIWYNGYENGCIWSVQLRRRKCVIDLFDHKYSKKVYTRTLSDDERDLDIKLCWTTTLTIPSPKNMPSVFQRTAYRIAIRYRMVRWRIGFFYERGHRTTGGKNHREGRWNTAYSYPGSICSYFRATIS